MQPQDTAGYSISGFTILAGMSLSQWAALAGIFGVLVTMFFQWRRDRREQMVADIQTGKKQDRRRVLCEDCIIYKEEKDAAP